MDLMTGLTGAVWLAIAAVLAAGIVDAWRRVFRSNAPLPFFRELETRGVTPARAEDAVGMTQLAGALRRCAFCAARPQCERGAAAADCPNEEILHRAAG